MSFSSPESPAALNSQYVASSDGPDQNSLRPNSFVRPASIHLMSPSSDIVGPSPVTSNGTEATEIEDDIADEHVTGNLVPHPSLMMLRTNLPDSLRKSTSEEIISVIHAPQSFQTWSSDPTKPPISSGLANTISASSLDGSLSPPASEQTAGPQTPPQPNRPAPGPTVNTDVKPIKFGIDAPTPQAQNLQDFLGEATRLRSSSASSLELIPEHLEAEEDQYDDYDQLSPPLKEDDSELKALWTALEECWTLCNTLANLSSIHRTRVFNSSGTPDAHEKAWKCCWKLCKRLYNSRDDTAESYNVRNNLDLCRDFCQALFDVRQRNDGVADSVLRVSFELNNHLYSAQDSRSLPEAFRERTLDFYITLCHRLMKQRSELAEETDSLLRTCWSLAEMLFNLRQNRRDGKAPDEEMLSSAVQACWELCDIFREGWKAVRPDRGTPRPSQVSFTSPGLGFATSPPSFTDRHSDRHERHVDRHQERQQMVERHQMQMMQAEARSNAGSRSSIHSKHSSYSTSRQSKRDSLRSLSEVSTERDRERDRPQRKVQPPVPETPVTEFEDTPISPQSSSPRIPNIMVLGTSSLNDARSAGRGGGWSSSASNLSSYSQGSQKTSSTATTTTASAEDVNVTRLKVLILKAAMNIGFNRDITPADGAGELTSLHSFVKSLPTGSFGSLPAHGTLLQSYKNLVLVDTAFRSAPGATLPTRGRRVNAQDVAKSVLWMMHRTQGQYSFLRDLFKLVFGFQVDDADTRKSVTIAV